MSRRRGLWTLIVDVAAFVAGVIAIVLLWIVFVEGGLK